VKNAERAGALGVIVVANNNSKPFAMGQVLFRRGGQMDRETQRGRYRESEREKVSVCACVCVRERERAGALGVMVDENTHAKPFAMGQVTSPSPKPRTLET